MPELPEVETTKRGINPWLVERRIEKLEVRQPSLRWPVPENLITDLPNHYFAPLVRRAKYLIFPLLTQEQQPAGWGLLWHLGMSGSLRLVAADEPWKTHDHIEVTLGRLDSDTHAPLRLRYHDPRRFGFLLTYEGNPEEHKLLSKLGPEPLSAEFTGVHLFQQAAKRKQAIKVFLMDNARVVGVGNIYATEALFTAGIDPRRPAGEVTLEEFERLAVIIRQLLLSSIEQGGTTLKDFVGGDGKPGYFAQQLNAYGRKGQPCVKCATALQEVKLGQRASVWCPSCQV